ncbi:Metallo-dependent hydrolase [Schizopora paradoxa]|uniref:Metallo-dependent hydrolase n=1 Tax=Schizopora paradoxa TaxID=27342 RepID=A0A0H2RI93_9AGAM|nr:Metallo-dependent hydrolase [Schizopora paradoxa]
MSNPPSDADPAKVAFCSLTESQLSILKSLPKAELHAHLNGCIPLAVLQQLASEYSGEGGHTSDAIRQSLDKLKDGVELKEISDFFSLFPTIYELTSTPNAIATATRAVLESFLDGDSPQCSYLELRSTPRTTACMSRREYVEAIVAEVEKYPAEKAALIVSVDRRMSVADAEECVTIAIDLKNAGRRVVGVDLCGDPLAGDMQLLKSNFDRAREAGLGITLHIAETEKNTSEDTLQLLSFKPDRLGHATFLDDAAKKIVLEQGICIEICLTSNILCKTVKSLQDHHVMYHFRLDHPVAICTDDTLPFRNSMLGEYALLMAEPPHGLGLKESEIKRIAEMGMQNRFPPRPRSDK